MISGIVLAGGYSKRLGQNKGLVEISHKPLITYVIDGISKLADEIIISIRSNDQLNTLARVLGEDVTFVMDEGNAHMPLAGAIAGFNKARGEYSFLLPCDTPFISSRIMEFLQDSCVGKDAAIPVWPKGYIEPLQAVYRTKSALAATKKALESGFTMREAVNNLESVCYVPTSVLQKFDRELMSFFNVNTSLDLRKAREIIEFNKVP